MPSGHKACIGYPPSWRSAEEPLEFFDRIKTTSAARGGEAAHGGGGGLVYRNWPSTAPKAGHGTVLRLTVCAPPHTYFVATWV